MPPATRRGARKPRARSGAATEQRDEPGGYEAAEVEIEIGELASHNESINILMYGPSGHGKTTLVGGTPNATFLSTESGVVAAKRSGSKARLMRAKNWDYCIAGLKKADEVLGPEDWLIVDSISKMQRLQIRGILKNQNEQNSSRDLDIPGLQDHQKWQNQFMRFVDRIYDAPYNSIIVAQSMIREDNEGDEQVLPALIGGQSWVDISHYMCAQADIVLYYAIAPNKNKNAQTTRRVLAQPYPPYFAKDRYDALGFSQDVAPGEYGAMEEFIRMIREAA